MATTELRAETGHLAGGANPVTQGPSWLRTPGPGLVLIAVVGALVHVHGLRKPFVIDDWLYLNIGQQPGGVTHYLAHPDSFVYRPVLVVWMTTLERLFGLRPSVFHLASLGLLLLGAGLLYRLARQLGLDVPAALLSTGALMVHPGLHGAISWAAAVNAILVIDFALLALLAVSVERPRPWQLLVGATAMLLAVASREDAIVLPIIAVALRAASPALSSLPWRTWTRWRPAVLPTWPLWIVVLAYNSMRLNVGASTKGTAYELALGPHIRSNSLRMLQFLTGFTLAASPDAWAALRWQRLALGIAALLLAGAVLATCRGYPLALAGLVWAALGVLPSLGLNHHPMDPYYVSLAVPGLALAVTAEFSVLAAFIRWSQ